ncbi:MAG TPA: MerR family transcriptional regulator [Acidobacteriaceae bacterium]|nr:MerR family transcriptional regulator [Acidobacteriaceae bacterium]
MNTFRIQAFAKLAGVTVRALHHYDRLGLLSPAHRSESGYRLYCHDDLGRLERILVLRYLGLSLRETAALLKEPGGRETESLSATLHRQRSVLRERRVGVDRVLAAIEHALARANAAEPDWLLYQFILKEIQMQEAQNWTDRYYSPEGLKALHERREALTPEEAQAMGVKWQALYNDLQAALERGVAPDSEEGRAFVARWLRIADEFSLGNPEIGEGFRRMYEDVNHWPDDETAAKLRRQMPKPEYMAFFKAAVHACLRHG